MPSTTTPRRPQCWRPYGDADRDISRRVRELRTDCRAHVAHRLRAAGHSLTRIAARLSRSRQTAINLLKWSPTSAPEDWDPLVWYRALESAVEYGEDPKGTLALAGMPREIERRTAAHFDALYRSRPGPDRDAARARPKRQASDRHAHYWAADRARRSEPVPMQLFGSLPPPRSGAGQELAQLAETLVNAERRM